MAPTYAAPKTAHASACHTALRARVRATGPYQRSQAARRCATRRAPIPVTRTSLPGGAVVATSTRCRARRLADAPRSSTARSTPGRHADVSTVGRANAASSASAGWIDTSSATVTPSRRIQPQVVNSDMYMWSSTKTWLRSIARRSRYAGRSWCSIVATDACSHATCDSRAMVTWSRNRRWVRSLITRRNHVAAARRHQLRVRAELDHLAVLQHADPIGVADGREAVRDQDRRGAPSGGEDAVEDLGLAADVELSRRLVEQHQPGAETHGAQRPRQRDALPLAARQLRAAGVAAGQHRVESGEARGTGRGERLLDRVVRSAPGSHVIAQRQLEAHEVLKHGGQARAPPVQLQGAEVHAVHLYGAILRIIQPAQELGDGSLPGAVLADDGERRAGWDREVEPRQHGLARGRVRERDVAEPDLVGRHPRGRSVAPDEGARGVH